MPDRCPHAPRIASRLADPAARLDASLAAHLPQCEACREAASAAVRNWPADRSPSPSLAEWLTDPTGPHTVVSPFQAEALGGGTLGALDLGPYLLLDRLGTGGMGEVYRGWHRLLRREDAVKTVRPELATNPDAVRRFLREAESAARVRHPNVVQVYTADRAANGGYYLAMEFVAGTDLARLVKESGPLPIPAACDYAAQAADGLQHAFASGLVHRDVKPQNVLVTEDRRAVKVTDFGLARAFAGDVSEFTAAGAVLGTADYMAPEQAEDARAADTRADVYALGGTLYFLLTGVVPYPSGSIRNKLERHAIAAVPDVRAKRPDAPPALAAVVQKCMAKRPADRYPTPGAVSAALRALSTPPPSLPPARIARPAPRLGPALSLPESLTLAESTPARPNRPRPSSRAWLWAVAALLLAAVAVALLVRGPKRDEGAKGEPPDSKPDVKPPPKPPSQWPEWVTVREPLPPGTTPPANVPLPRPKGAAPWRFVSACWSDRVDKVRAVGFLSDGSVVGGRDGEKQDGSDVGVWEVWPPTGGTPIRGGRPPTTERHERPVMAHAAGLITNQFQRFDPLTFAALPFSRDMGKIDSGNAEGLDAAVATPDGKYIVGAAMPDGGKKRSYRLVAQWKAESGAAPRGGQVETDHNVHTVAVSADGHTTATITTGGQIVVMHTTRDTKKWYGPKPKKDERTGEVAIDPLGERVYTAHDAERTILVWDAVTGQQVDKLPMAGWSYALAVSPDGRWLAAGGEAVSVWDLKAKPPTRYDLADSYAGQLWAVAFDEKSERLAVAGLGHNDTPDGSEGVVWLWQKGP